MFEPLCMGVDYAQPHNRDQVRALRAMGVSFVVRYLTLPQLAWKRLTRAEAEMLSAEHMNIVSVYQARMNTPVDFTVSHAKRDAEAALQNAREVGQPKGSVIYFAVDFDAGPQHLQTLRDYFSTVKQVLGTEYQVGVYGSYWTIDNLASLVPYRWQTYAWSKGKLHAVANLWPPHLYQCHNGVNFVGGSNDLNFCYLEPGWWRVGGALEPTKPKYPWPFWRAMKRGSRGPDVEELQRLLLQKGFDPQGIDGIFGPKTETAVNSFLTSVGLPANGIVTPEVYIFFKDKDYTGEVLQLLREAQERINQALDILGAAK